MTDDPTEALPPRGRNLRILVVEDHADTLKVLARMLDHFGHEISLTDGALSALEIVALKEFDVVLSDIGLPGGNGYEAIDKAKRKQPLWPSPVLTKKKMSGAAKKPASTSILPNRSTFMSCVQCSRRSVLDPNLPNFSDRRGLEIYWKVVALDATKR